MKPVVAIVGRPNVGKSTLFNSIARKNLAIIDDQPNVTRDRHYAEANFEGRSFILIDTGGFDFESSDEMLHLVRQQVEMAIEEADLLLFVVDGSTGLVPSEEDIANFLRKSQKPVFYVLNKMDIHASENNSLDFCRFGQDRLYRVSAKQRSGFAQLLGDVVAALPPASPETPEISAQRGTRLAFIGRPNVGKSSLINRIINEDRLIVSPIPGTTRDAIDVGFTYKNRNFTLIDTAGIRRKARVSEKLEKYSILFSMKKILECDIACLLIDAEEGACDQDKRVAGLAHDQGRGVIIIVNKADQLPKHPNAARDFEDRVRFEMKYLHYAPILFTSAKTGKNVAKVLPLAAEIAQAYEGRIPTAQLNQFLQKALDEHAPPVVNNKRLKFYYMNQVEVKPPLFVIVSNSIYQPHFSYERYLKNSLREAFGLNGFDVKLKFKEKERKEFPEPTHKKSRKGN
jgi:GTP-binding protein